RGRSIVANAFRCSFVNCSWAPLKSFPSVSSGLSPINLRVALYTNACTSNAGGGVLYLSGWAQALREFGRVDLFFPGNVSTRELSDFCGLDLDGVAVA